VASPARRPHRTGGCSQPRARLNRSGSNGGSIRDAELTPLIQGVFDANYRVYGARKIWHELQRQGHTVARCTVERLMREIGIAGAVRGKKVISTIADPAATRAPDLVDRDFLATAPNRCWVADFTHIATWAGVVYVAFVVDTFSRRVVGWSASTTKEAQLVLDSLKMGIWQRDRDGRPHTPGELVHHSDAGSGVVVPCVGDRCAARWWSGRRVRRCAGTGRHTMERATRNPTSST
jgi:putative transposase